MRAWQEGSLTTALPLLHHMLYPRVASDEPVHLCISVSVCLCVHVYPCVFMCVRVCNQCICLLRLYEA